METLNARLISADCAECRDHLLTECREIGLPLPTGEVFLVPDHWAHHRCPHRENGFELDFRTVRTNWFDSNGQFSAESMRCKDEDDAEIEAPEWWNNIDATKDIGYPVREQGRYGSHPAHDAFDDESDP